MPRPAVQRAASVSMAIEDMPGKYAIDGALFDPLGLSTRFDVKWLREAELKHGRLCMVATLGYVSVDLGFKIPNHDWSSFAAAHVSLSAPLAALSARSCSLLRSLRSWRVSRLISSRDERWRPRAGASLATHCIRP